MFFQFHDFHQIILGINADTNHTGGRHAFAVSVVEFVTVTVALADFVFAVSGIAEIAAYRLIDHRIAAADPIGRQQGIEGIADCGAGLRPSETDGLEHASDAQINDLPPDHATATPVPDVACE